jgi:hypothetical protein
MSFDSINSSELVRERIIQFKEVNIAEKMQKMIDFTKRKLAIAQESQKRHVDSVRNNNSTPNKRVRFDTVN